MSSWPSDNWQMLLSYPRWALTSDLYSIYVPHACLLTVPWLLWLTRWTFGTAVEVLLAWATLNSHGWRLLVGLSALPFGEAPRDRRSFGLGAEVSLSTQTSHHVRVSTSHLFSPIGNVDGVRVKLCVRASVAYFLFPVAWSSSLVVMCCDLCTRSSAVPRSAPPMN